MKTYDLLVIGSGIAGLLSAIKVATANGNATVALITKSDLNTSNTRMAQGGVAATLTRSQAKLEGHVQDTLRAGAGLCNEAIVRMVVNEGTKRINELIDFGVQFDQAFTNLYDLAKEGGHSVPRILHHKDKTGEEIQRTLLHQAIALPNLKLFSHHQALDLIIKKDQAGNTCHGSYVLDVITGEVQPFLASMTMLATGGIGQVYPYSTNPTIATGDGIGIAFRAGAQVTGMEFIQFHPTALYSKETECSVFLISEAVRGFGAHLLNNRKERFMHRYSDLGELACRDHVSQAVEAEMQEAGVDFVYLDCRHLNKTAFRNHFPAIVNKLSNEGLDFTSDLIPVHPAMHYLCGGIKVNNRAQTSIHHLLACGECAHTGMHGANRLASNSLLEAMVFAHICAEEALTHLRSIPHFNYYHAMNIQQKSNRKAEDSDFLHTRKKKIQSMVGRYAGIRRSDRQLVQASSKLKDIQEEIEDYYQTHEVTLVSSELRNLALVAQLIVCQSIERQKSIGAFYKRSEESKIEFDGQMIRERTGVT